ncbi:MULTISPECIES: HlyD family type I secretion periplasmic adaptor subunit [Niveibacterium]|uniref:Membrane fusion protein (MFP) family protein n=1 Tax=Niveibacterium microcysteis TaxID=2811415 RepID=A0ABX7M9E7_9RHOO|nr:MULTISPECIES: HlyD family type I secretion periplasmic adaptor subunit [Niveibacterium]QSI78360.1 HlyD family type I secretion periplasmic adaptor subunit [Niveibacterium microcysteis]
MKLRIPALLQRAGQWSFRKTTGALDRLLLFASKRDLHDDADFLADADWAIAEQTPRGARLAVWISLAAVVVLIIWAAFAQIDEVTRGDGKVIPFSQNQLIQSLDGGIVQQILVREGQTVEKGQLLLKIDPTRFVSSLRENRSQYLSLLAKAARLEAIAEGRAYEPPPEALKEVPDVVEQERAAFESKRLEVEATVGIARQQLTQRTQELNEVRARREQASQSYDLTARELEVTRPLTKTGAVSDVELLRLERDVARYRGERDAANAQIPRIQAAIGEAQRKIQEVELQMKNQARSDLSDVSAKLGTLSEGSVALADRVKQSEVRAPMRGTVKQIFVHTVGGVVQPGKEVVAIVPSDDALLLEARVLPKDIAFLRPGQKAQVKFTAYDFSIYGGLEGTLEQIGADTVVDEKGNAFYEVRVRTTTSTIGPKKLPIIPGMVAEVDILTGKKSILTYLLKPVIRAKAAAMTER